MKRMRTNPPGSRRSYPTKLFAALGALGLAAGVTALSAGASPPANPAAVGSLADGAAQQGTVVASPPAGLQPQHLSILAWLVNGQSCWGSADLTAPQQTETRGCRPAPSASTRRTAPTLWSKPHFLASPSDPSGRFVVVVGFLQGPATTVDVTMTSGVVVHARAVSLEGSNPGGVEAYEAVLPMPSKKGIGWQDIARVTAHNASGAIIAQLS